MQPESSSDRTTRFDFDTGPGRGGTYATETYNGLGARFARHDAFGQVSTAAIGGPPPAAFDSPRAFLLYL